MSSEVYYRSWMDKPHLDPNTNLLTEEYVQGIGEFMRLVQQQPDAKSGMLRCPCSSCNNNKVIKEFDVDDGEDNDDDVNLVSGFLSSK
ncbi:hypothetical protein F2Q68_00020489 [Brassica cretica]|uniref:Transposase-associated domain-containing protein n=1 Tax=Brassica cretica TaxID=69181 RepID=A0A8S9G1S1_BRACR|nr:hypothetical protein F2Q68_00020489 [Brassica cretica]